MHRRSLLKFTRTKPRISGVRVTVFGDSVSEGYMLPDKTTERFYAMYCNHFGLTENNLAIPGTTMQASARVNSLESRVSEIPTFVEGLDHTLWFNYALNDAALIGSAENYEAVFQMVVNSATAKGWNTDRIKCIASFYSINTTTGYQDYYTALVNKNIAVCAANGIDYYEMRRWFGDNVGASGLYDSVHPNVDGSIALANRLILLAS